MVSSALAPATPHRDAPSEGAPGTDRVDIERLFDTYGITPMPLASRRIPLDILRAYENWCEKLGIWLDPGSEPWLPVGSVGPLMILGHYQPPKKQPSLLPPWMSGRSLVPEETYRRIAADLADSRAATAVRPEAPRAVLPETPPGFPDDRAALQFVLEQFVLEPATRAVGRAAFERGTPAAELPLGLRETVMFLRQRSAVVDVRFLEVPKEILGLSLKTTRDYHGFCFKRTPSAFFVAFHEVPPTRPATSSRPCSGRRSRTRTGARSTSP